MDSISSAGAKETLKLPSAQITIVVPSFNQGRFINATLSSIFEQDLPVEVFVMDGGSTDNSLNIIKQWAPKLAGWRSHHDSGQAAAINEGIVMGTAPYVCWLNSDDFFYADGLKKLLRCLKENPEYELTYGKCWAVSEAGKKRLPYLTLPFSPWLFANFCFIAQPATLMTRKAWQRAGGLNENLHLAFDYDLWWQLYTEFGKPIYCKSFVAATRMHKNTKTTNQTGLHYQESIAIVGRNWGSVPLKWQAALPVMKLIRKLNK